MDPRLRSLIFDLLQVEMTDRITIQAIMVHPFFDEIDFTSDLS